MNARLGRVHLRVTDIDRATWFYTRVLGLRVCRRETRAVFLGAGDGRHELALHGDEPGAPPPPLWLGCRFVGFEVPSKHALVKACERLDGARASIVVTGDTWAVHTTDPDGNGVEIYCFAQGASIGDPETARTVSLLELQSAAAADSVAVDARHGVTV